MGRVKLGQCAGQYSGHFFERFHKAFRVYGSRIELFFQS